MKKEMKHIAPEMVESFIKSEEYICVGKKTTICLLTAINGMEVVGTAVRQDTVKHNESVGNEWARLDAFDKIYGLAICYYNAG